METKRQNRPLLLALIFSLVVVIVVGALVLYFCQHKEGEKVVEIDCLLYRREVADLTGAYWPRVVEFWQSQKVADLDPDLRHRTSLVLGNNIEDMIAARKSSIGDDFDIRLDKIRAKYGLPPYGPYPATTAVTSAVGRVFDDQNRLLAEYRCSEYGAEYLPDAYRVEKAQLQRIFDISGHPERLDALSSKHRIRQFMQTINLPRDGCFECWLHPETLANISPHHTSWEPFANEIVWPAIKEHDIQAYLEGLLDLHKEFRVHIYLVMLADAQIRYHLPEPEANPINIYESTVNDEIYRGAVNFVELESIESLLHIYHQSQPDGPPESYTESLES